MGKEAIQRRDVTHDPQAESRLVQAPDLRDALATLGFGRVGLVESRAPAMVKPEQLKSLIAGPDADLLVRAIEEGEVDEVLTSPDRRAFGTVENFFGGPVVCLRTILESGIVVETTKRPVRRPQMGAAVQGVLMRMTVGALPLWTRENWPRSGYYLELMDTRDMRALWQRHRQRVEQIAQANGARVRPHDDLRLFVCISQRGFDIIEHKGRWQGYFSALTIVLLMACIFLTVAAVWIWRKALSEALEGPGAFRGFIAAVPLLFMLLVAILAFPLMGFFRAVVVPRLPGPRLQPVDELLRQAPPL